MKVASSITKNQSNITIRNVTLSILPVLLTSRQKKLRNLTVIFRYSSNIPKKPAQQGEIQYEEAPVQGETYVSYLLRKWGFLAYI